MHPVGIVKPLYKPLKQISFSTMHLGANDGLCARGRNKDGFWSGLALNNQSYCVWDTKGTTPVKNIKPAYCIV